MFAQSFGNLVEVWKEIRKFMCVLWREIKLIVQNSIKWMVTRRNTTETNETLVWLLWSYDAVFDRRKAFFSCCATALKSAFVYFLSCRPREKSKWRQNKKKKHKHQQQKPKQNNHDFGDHFLIDPKSCRSRNNKWNSIMMENNSLAFCVGVKLYYEISKQYMDTHVRSSLFTYSSIHKWAHSLEKCLKTASRTVDKIESEIDATHAHAHSNNITCWEASTFACISNIHYIPFH